jgi:hypothetical protein
MDSGLAALRQSGMTEELTSDFPRDCPLYKQSRFERGVIAAKAADDLNAERQAVAVV